MSDEELLTHLFAQVTMARDAGSPVASGDDESRRQIAAVALRRWRSGHRRIKRKIPTHEQRIEDLAKGLRDTFEFDPSLTGRLMSDYRHLARVLADVLAG